MQQPDKYRVEKEEITAIYHENQGRYGYRRITLEMRNRGYYINHKTVSRLMKVLGLKCQVRIKKYRSYKGEIGKIAPNLINRDFHAEAPNQKWTTDVTEFALLEENFISLRFWICITEKSSATTLASILYLARCWICWTKPS